jgi:hypothetical protein
MSIEVAKMRLLAAIQGGFVNPKDPQNKALLRKRIQEGKITQKEIDDASDKAKRAEAIRKEEYEDLWDKLNQSPTIQAVPDGYGLFFEDTEVLIGRGDMFERYERKSGNKKLAKQLVTLVRGYTRKDMKGRPYILQEDYRKIKDEINKMNIR